VLEPNGRLVREPRRKLQRTLRGRLSSYAIVGGRQAKTAVCRVHDGHAERVQFVERSMRKLHHACASCALTLASGNVQHDNAQRRPDTHAEAARGLENGRHGKKIKLNDRRASHCVEAKCSTREPIRAPWS
jgi:hypothetical protein